MQEKFVLSISPKMSTLWDKVPHMLLKVKIKEYTTQAPQSTNYKDE